MPYYDCASWSRVGKGYIERPVAAPKARGSGTGAAMALRAACSWLQIKESKQKKRGVCLFSRIVPLHAARRVMAATAGFYK